MSEFDYQKLLILYINHVRECEGVTFLGSGWRLTERISEIEWKELQRLKALSEEEWNKRPGWKREQE